ncbi:VOC family protein [Clostridium sp. UBA4548]|uniref:VOC family protein n=1 Tax=Clostridium sp. UBA4548 TaxID=1946361 RepID=UPI0025C213CA|nr:VOC family protein [Clostridium sp. UBA4548]
MHLGSIYLIVRDFQKSIIFYEKLLQMPVTKKNMDRFAMFDFEGKCIALMNGYFDSENPDKVIHKGEYLEYFDDLKTISTLLNSRKVVLNFWDENLREEYNRVKELDITGNITKIKYVCNVSPYYYFQLTDPDGNIIEVTGDYHPEVGEFDE